MNHCTLVAGSRITITQGGSNGDAKAAVRRAVHSAPLRHTPTPTAGPWLARLLCAVYGLRLAQPVRQLLVNGERRGAGPAPRPVAPSPGAGTRATLQPPKNGRGHAAHTVKHSRKDGNGACVRAIPLPLPLPPPPPLPLPLPV